MENPSFLADTSYLPAAKVNQLLCRGKKRPATLDVYVEDDTIVDWIRVTIYSQ